MGTRLRWMTGLLCGLAGLGCAAEALSGEGRPVYADRASLEQYAMASIDAEIALARSAAPASISGAAEVLTLGKQGYETAVHGHNGFVCLVERSWGANLKDLEFWNARVRAPICMNPAAVRSVLPPYLERTRWVLAGLSRAQMLERTHGAVAARTYRLPEPGAMGLMQSKQGYLGDSVNGHWHPHLMLYMPRIDPATWGANLEGSPVLASQGDPERVTVCLVPLPTWSDGTADAAQTRAHL
jgi:hypothetical protein